MKKEKCYDFGFTLILFLFWNIFVTSLFWIFKISISSWNFVIASILTLLCYGYISYRHHYKKKETILNFIFLVIAIAGSFIIAGLITDNSCDGNLYHKVAVGEMKLGWNPVFQDIDEFNQKNNLKLPDTASNWTDHYGKATWIYAANIYKFTGIIETGKSITILTILATFFIAFSFFKFKNNYLNYILSFLIAINPVILCQIGTFYNDGILGNFIMIMLISLTVMALNKEKNIQNYILYFLILTILINIKFTGFAYAGLHSIIYYIYFLLNKKQRKQNIKSVTITAIISLIIGIGIIGLSTYPKNFFDHRNPFYPLFGNDAVDIMETNTPTGLLEKNRIQRFLISNFSNTTNDINNGIVSYRIKIPFTYTRDELFYFTVPDARIAGYGVVFGGILLMSLIGFIYYFYKNHLQHKETLLLLLIPLLALFLIILLVKESWWARYLPQLYIIPIITVIALSFIKGKISNFISKFIVLFLIINSYLIGNAVSENIVRDMILGRNEFKNIKSLVQENSEVRVSSNGLSGTIFNVVDQIPQVKIDDTVCTNENKIYIMKEQACIVVEPKEF